MAKETAKKTAASAVDSKAETKTATKRRGGKSVQKPITVDLSAVALGLTALDFSGNVGGAKAVLDNLRTTRDENPNFPAADLRFVVFPELTTTGPGAQDAFLRPETLRGAISAVLTLESELVKTPNVVATVGTPLAFGGAIYKANAVFAGGELRGFVCSTFLPNDGRDLARQFSPWPLGKTETIAIQGREFPIGDLEFEERGVRFAIRSFDELAREVGESDSTFFDPERFDEKTLYDPNGTGRPASKTSDRARNPEMKKASLAFEAFVDALKAQEKAARFARKTNAKVVLVPGATPFVFGGQARVRRALEKYSARLGGAVVYSTPNGIDSGATIYDGGFGIAFDGDFCQGVRFLTANALLGTNRFEIRGDKIEFGDLETCDFGDRWEIWEDDAQSVKFEEFSRAASFALLDYLAKSRTRGFALSLSGGADSATIALLVRLGVKYGCRRVGPALFADWLARAHANGGKDAFPELQKITNEYQTNFLNATRELVGEKRDATPFDAALEKLDDETERRIVGALLTTFYQATRNSGETTRLAAVKIAEFCGSTHYELDVDALVEGYKTLIADATGKPFSWTEDDAALQNVQARTRAPSAWLLANRDGRLLLSTGNRSEAACGYATMDGDSAGCLSPISGVDKAFIRDWLRWLETTGTAIDVDEETEEPIRFKVPAARFVNEQQPTAELRPAEAKQTDEADLMPYSILNLFERALIRDRLPLETAILRVVDEAKERGIDVDSTTLTLWAVKFCRLWRQSQWKRGRYALGFRLDDYDLAPTSWTKFPVLSAAFDEEIAALQEKIDGAIKSAPKKGTKARKKTVETPTKKTAKKTR